MKKYLQIGAILGVFFLIVWYRSSQGSANPPVIGQGNALGAGTNSNPSTGSSSSSGSSTPPPSQQGSAASSTTASYKDGTYTGSTEDAFYGLVQVQATISGGKITNVNFLQYPNDNRTSQYINSQAMPMLQSEAIQAQSANVNIISGASDTSAAFQTSLGNALAKAK